MSDQKFTLGDITASWLGHGKQIPIGQMMAWLIKEVERLNMELPQRAIKEAEIDEKEMEILQLSESLDDHKKLIVEYHNQYKQWCDTVDQLRERFDALWHFSVCPFDHCERCIKDESVIKQIREEVATRKAGLNI